MANGAKYLRSASKYTPEETLVYTHTYTHYDQIGHLRTQKLIGHLGTATYTYDPLGRVTSVQAPGFHQQIEKFDPCGNILSMQRQDVPHTYTYNSLSHFTEETGPIPHTYLCDSISRRLEKDTLPQNSNILNQLFSAYNHDPNGNPLHHHRTRQLPLRPPPRPLLAQNKNGNISSYLQYIVLQKQFDHLQRIVTKWPC